MVLGSLGLGLGLGLGPIHTQIGTPIEAAESVVGAVSVSESYIVGYHHS